MSHVPSTAVPFRHAFERYEQPLIRYAMRIVRDQERARDIVQDTFLRMCESDVDANDPRLGSWLYTVCRNRAIDVRRRDSRMSAMERPPEIEVEPSGEHHRAVNEVFARAGTLPDKKARVLELHYRQGRSYRQIADQTGMSVSHVGVVLHDCIKFLRKNMSVVAAFAVLVGAGAWGIASSRAPAPEPSYFSHEQAVLPMIEHAELPPEEALYGPEPFYGPELPRAAELPRPAELPRAAEQRLALPREMPAMPSTSPNGLPSRAKSKAKKPIPLRNAYEAPRHFEPNGL